MDILMWILALNTVWWVFNESQLANWQEITLFAPIFLLSAILSYLIFIFFSFQQQNIKKKRQTSNFKAGIQPFAADSIFYRSLPQMSQILWNLKQTFCNMSEWHMLYTMMFVQAPQSQYVRQLCYHYKCNKTWQEKNLDLCNAAL